MKTNPKQPTPIESAALELRAAKRYLETVIENLDYGDVEEAKKYIPEVVAILKSASKKLPK